MQPIYPEMKCVDNGSWGVGRWVGKKPAKYKQKAIHNMLLHSKGATTQKGLHTIPPNSGAGQTQLN